MKLLIYAAGLFTIMAAVVGWDWFFEHPKARFFVDRFGRDGARMFYAGLGVAIIVLGFICLR